VFSINKMSVSDSCESCASSHCLHAARTCDARRRRVVRAYSSCIILALSRAVRTRCRVPFARVVVCHVRMSRVSARRHASLRAIALPARYRVDVRVPFTRCLRVVDISFARSCHASGSCVARHRRVIIN
jgi:hypothetical protein